VLARSIRLRALLLAGVLPALVACHPSTDPMKTPGPPIKMLDRTVAASSDGEVLPLAVGQWTRVRVRRPDETSVLTDKVIGKAGDAFWIESVLLRPGRKVITQVLVAMNGPGSPGEVRELRVKMPDDKLQDYRGRQLKSAGLMYQRVLASLRVPKLAASPREDVHVPAGVFKGCYRRHIQSKYRNINADASVWTHPAVPINGTVKAQSDNKEITVELVDFGTTGAKSSL
jgi:hypothetical protein